MPPGVETPFNPLDKRNLGVSVADAMLAKAAVSLAAVPQFMGAGIYAIYYTGDFPAYAAISERNRDGKYGWPIYVGKAIPRGSRQGGFGLGADPGTALWKRLAEHADSIRQVASLKIEDFSCRYLVVEDIWIPLGESLLIEMFSPLWNRSLDGFGNHDPGSGRAGQQRSAWDVVHEGRAWATRLQNNLHAREVIFDSVRQFIESHLPPSGPTT